MPIRFRCGYCNRLLGIARRKAGSETTCPHCGYTLTVPEDPVGDTSEMDDIDALLNPMTSPAPPERPTAPERSPSPLPKAPISNGASTSPSSLYPSNSGGGASTTAPAPRSSGERPLFERKVEEVLGTPQLSEESKNPTPVKIPVSGMDALSLESDRNEIVLSVQKVTLLAILAVVLIGISFAAGYLLASNK